jgi:CBS domain containing-hemolysin-like protein
VNEIPWQSLVSLAGFLFFLFLDAVLVACETFMVRLRYATVDQKALDQARQTPATARLLEHSHRVARTIRWGGILTTLSVGFFLFPLIEGLLGGPGVVRQWPWWPVLFWLCLSMAFGFQVIFAEMIPRGLAMANSMRTLRSTSFFLIIFQYAVTPVFRVLERLAARILRVLGVEQADEYNMLDVEVQLRALSDKDEVGLSPHMRQIVSNALRIRDLEVSDVLLPRNQVQYFEIGDGLEANLEKARATGHTRFPLCEGDLDNTLGIIHIKDVFRYRGQPEKLDLRAIKRDITRVPIDLPLEQALRKLLALKMHMALAVDPFGGVAGVITLERILEELVGEIRDEFDAAEELPEIRRNGAEAYFVHGLTPIHDLEESLGVDVENEEVSTFGGLITAEIGRIPERGEHIEIQHPRLDVRIDEVDERRIIRTTVRVLPEPEEAEQA